MKQILKRLESFAKKLTFLVKALSFLNFLADNAFFLKKNMYFIFFAVLLFFTPLIAVSNTKELFEFPKMFFVYFFGLFVIIFFISDILFNPIKLKMPSALVSAFFLVTFISTIFSSHFYTSVFGYYTRFNDGLLLYLIFFGLYFVAINKLKKEDYLKLLKMVTLTVIPISIYGLAQHFGGSSFLWSYPAVDRVFSTLGQPNWLAQYLAMILLACLYFALSENYKNFKFWFMVYVFGFFCFWVTYSMSGILGFLAGLAILSLNFYKKKVEPENFALRTILLFLITVSIAISNLGLFREKLNDAVIDIKKGVTVVLESQKVYAQGSEYKISDPGFIRLELWKSSVDLIKSSPKVFLIGTGPETYPYAFQPFRNLKLNYSSEWDYVFNKPHNYYLEIWSESGIFALIIYLVLLRQLFKKLPECATPALAAFAVTNIFGWPVVATSFLFWFFLSWSEA